MVLIAIAFPLGLATSFPKLHYEFQKSVGEAECKNNGEDKNIDEKLKINICPRAIQYAGLKEIHSHYDEQAPLQK